MPSYPPHGLVGYDDELQAYIDGQDSAVQTAAASDATTKAAAAQAAAEAFAQALIDALTSADITDATAIGKALLTAVDAATARAAIGAGTSSQNLPTMSQAEAEAGIAATASAITAAVMKAAIVQFASWSSISGKPAVVAEGATQALARAAIGIDDNAQVTSLTGPLRLGIYDDLPTSGMQANDIALIRRIP